MAFGNRIIVTPEPKGRFEEFLVSGTPKPGQWMGIKPGVAAVGGSTSAIGRFTYEPAGVTAAAGSRGMAASGDRIAVCILLGFQDSVACPPGFQVSDAYVDGQRGAGYWAQNGDLLNCLFKNVAGTADDVAVGDKMIIDDGTGKVSVSTGAVESEPLEAREALIDPTADALICCVWCNQ